ncbi:MAG: toast rack family protein [Candidatus Aminicenantales bacterium]
MRLIPLILILSLILGCLVACVRVGEMEEESQKIPLGDAESLDIHLRMNAGEMRIQGGTSELMDGYFQYNIRRWKPKIEHKIADSKGILTIQQRKSSGIPLGKTRNRWEISFNPHLPLDLEIDFGAGEARLDFQELHLRHLDVHMGVGDLTLNLAGERKFSMNGAIKGGIGHATIYLPQNIGVRVTVDGGIGSVNASGFMKSGETYTNKAFGTTDVSIDLKIKAGIGSIDLKLR